MARNFAELQKPIVETVVKLKATKEPIYPARPS